MERSVQNDLHLDWIPALRGNDASGPIIKGRVKILEVLVCRMNQKRDEKRGASLPCSSSLLRIVSLQPSVL